MKNEKNHYGSSNDKEDLKPDNSLFDLPEVEDIPGQEHINVPKMREFQDTTISSADEEGDGIFFREDDTANVTSLERDLLKRSAEENPGNEDEETVRSIALDNTDNENEPLNENSIINDREGEDFDLPESEETTEEETGDNN